MWLFTFWTNGWNLASKTCSSKTFWQMTDFNTSGLMLDGLKSHSKGSRISSQVKDPDVRLWWNKWQFKKKKSSTVYCWTRGQNPQQVIFRCLEIILNDYFLLVERRTWSLCNSQHPSCKLIFTISIVFIAKETNKESGVTEKDGAETSQCYS